MAPLRRRTCRHALRGHSLTELLVAVTVGSIAAGLALQLVALGLARDDELSRREQVSARFRNSIEVLRRDLGRADEVVVRASSDALRLFTEETAHEWTLVAPPVAEWRRDRAESWRGKTAWTIEPVARAAAAGAFVDDRAILKRLGSKGLGASLREQAVIVRLRFGARLELRVLALRDEGAVPDGR